MSRAINGITNEAAAEITKLFKTVHENEKLVSYLLSDAYREQRQRNDHSCYWSLRYGWAEAMIKLDDKFGITLPNIEYVRERIEYFEDKKYSERKRNAEKSLEETEKLKHCPC
jgi:hypothetical protein